jgi:hypothetical protein
VEAAEDLGCVVRAKIKRKSERLPSFILKLSSIIQWINKCKGIKFLDIILSADLWSLA